MNLMKVEKTVIEKRLRVLLALALMCLTISLLGACSSKSGKSPQLSKPHDLPSGEGGAECRLLNATKPVIRLSRKEKTVDLPGPQGLLFHPGDRLENTSEEILRLSAVTDEATFSMRLRAKIEFKLRSLVVKEGRVRMEFSRVKGVYSIRLPVVVLAVRGTRLDVTVNEDQTSEVVLLEGKIGLVDKNGAETIMEAGQRALIPAKEDGKVVFTPLGDIKDSFEDLSDEKAIKTIR